MYAEAYIYDLFLCAHSTPDAHFIHDAKKVLGAILRVRIGIYTARCSCHGVEAATLAILLPTQHQGPTRGDFPALATSNRPHLRSQRKRVGCQQFTATVAWSHWIRLSKAGQHGEKHSYATSMILVSAGWTMHFGTLALRLTERCIQRQECRFRACSRLTVILSQIFIEFL